MIEGQRLELWREPEDMTYGAWTERPDGEFVVPNDLSHSDHGSIRTRVNHETFIEEFAEHEGTEWFRIRGSSGTRAILIRVDADERVPELGKFVADYGDSGYSADDNREYELLQEAIEEEWGNWGHQEFVRVMVQLDPRLRDRFDDLDDDAEVAVRLRNAVASVEGNGETPYETSEGISFDPYFQVLKRAHREDEDALLVAFDLASSPEVDYTGYASHAGELPLDYLFKEIGGGQWTAKARMPAFYYALLEFQPEAARIIGNKPNAIDFAFEFAASRGIDRSIDLAIAMTLALRTKGRDGKLRKMDKAELLVLTDAIQEAPFDEEDGFDFSTAFRMLQR